MTFFTHPKRRKTDDTPARSFASHDLKISPPPHGDGCGPTANTTFDDEDDTLLDFLRPLSGGVKEAPEAVVDLTVDTLDAMDANGAGFRRGEPECPIAAVPAEPAKVTAATESARRTVTSPFRLIRIRGLPNSEKKDTVGIDDILGDVMLREV